MRLGMWLLVGGLAVAALGALLLVAPRLFSWFGRLPGDLRIEGAHGRIYVPIASMILVSVALTVVANVVAWIAQRFR